MSACEFLVGRTVRELRVRDGVVHVVFEFGDRAEPGLYAELGSCSFVDAAGTSHEPAGRSATDMRHGR